VPKPQWSDFGAIWKTIREVDINAIRHEAERGVAIVCLGQPPALWWVDRFLRDGPNRYPLSSDPLALVPIAEAGDYLHLLPAADLLIGGTKVPFFKHYVSLGWRREMTDAR